MHKLILVVGITGCLLGLGTANSVQAVGEPTLDSVPSSSVPQGTEVTVTVKARPADPNHVLAYALWTKNGTFTEFGPLYAGSAVQYFPQPFSPGPGKINRIEEGWKLYENADGVFTFTADAVPGKYDIGCGVTVASGPNAKGPQWWPHLSRPRMTVS